MELSRRSAVLFLRDESRNRRNTAPIARQMSVIRSTARDHASATSPIPRLAAPPKFRTSSQGVELHQPHPLCGYVDSFSNNGQRLYYEIHSSKLKI